MRSPMLNSRTLAVVLAAVLLTQCGAPLPAYGQWRTSVSNVRFQAEQSKVTITYDLAGSQEDEYDVGVTLRKESDKTFKLVPADLQGDAGRGRFAGQHRKITWNLSKELPQGLAGSDYYFEVSAEKTTSNTLF